MELTRGPKLVKLVKFIEDGCQIKLTQVDEPKVLEWVPSLAFTDFASS